MLKRTALAALALVAATVPAFAHPGAGEHGSFTAGLLHPLFGLDHVLAMVAVGLWAAQIGGRAVWIVPAAFVGTMGAGFLLGLSGATLPFVEPAIAASVVVLGLLIAMAVRLPAAAGAAVAGLFALFHGYAHASELGAAGALSFGAGFALATALLHSAGIGLGLLLGTGSGVATAPRPVLARLLGVGTAIAGVALMAG